ncbi:MAG: noncanonical pyrimidine nucleotidase, YjjG family [Flavobacteriales bacterium]|nr:noncanonical pyrimidine nucleotidase, YjjG family [Flavobacteriales bacterium]
MAVLAYKHLFFDLDRTLWDFETNSETALGEILFELDLIGQVPSSEEFISRYREINEHYWNLYRLGQMEKSVLRVIRFQKALEAFGIQDSALSERFANRYVEVSPQKTHLMEGAVEALEYLKSRQYAMHIITNGFEEVQHIKLDRSGLQPYFDLVLTSEIVGRRKPDPRVFDHALNHVGAETDNSIMIGDDLGADIVGAREFGMDQIFYNPNSHEHSEKVTHEISSLHQLCELL